MADYNPNQFDPLPIPKMVKVTWDDHEEWSALYVNGKLAEVGDHYIVDERIAYLAQVKHVEMDFLVGNQIREATPLYLADLEEFHKATVGRREKAERLRAQAQALLDEAAGLES